LFQEKFKDFEAHPPLEVWDKIAERLDADKNKKRVIPWWYWTCGVAALFIIGFLGYNLFTNSRDLPALERQIPVANTTTETEKKTDKKDRLDIKDSDELNVVTFVPDNGGVDTLQDVSDKQTNEIEQYPVTISPNSSGVNCGKQKTNALAKSDKHSTQSKSKRKAENNLTTEESI
ncbi:hypothetical protein RZS08_10950, partial [Arthrospira platensis SPKY1]|nr:hypothetical protein [Arthrospira platensis SPKY1]